MQSTKSEDVAVATIDIVKPWPVLVPVSGKTLTLFDWGKYESYGYVECTYLDSYVTQEVCE